MTTQPSSLSELAEDLRKQEETKRPLTPREMSIIPYLFIGLTYKEVGEKLRISSATTKNHVGKILKKMGARNKEHLIYRCLELGLLKSPEVIDKEKALNLIEPLVNKFDTAAQIEKRVKQNVPLEKDLVPFEGWTLKKSNFSVVFNNKVRRMLVKEFNLLYAMSLRPSHVFHRQTLINIIYGTGVFIEERTIDVYVRRIRHFFEINGYSSPIKTIREGGYQFCADISPLEEISYNSERKNQDADQRELQALPEERNLQSSGNAEENNPVRSD